MLRKTVLALCSLCLFACAERPVPSGPPPPWMDRAVYDQVAPFGPHQLLGGIFRGITLDEDRGLRWQVQLERDRCYAFSAVGSETVAELRLEIWDPQGTRLFTVNSKQRLFKGFCVDGRVYQSERGYRRGYMGGGGFGWGYSRWVPPRLAQAQPGIYEFELKTTDGYGHVELGVFVAMGYAPPPPPAQTPAPPAPPPSAPVPPP